MSEDEGLWVAGPGELLQVIPRLLGFLPANDFVVIGGGGERYKAPLKVIIRYDLTDDALEVDSTMAHAVDALRRVEDVQAVLAVGYGAEPEVTYMMGRFTAVMSDAGLEIYDELRVENEHWWSYHPHSDGEAHPFDTTTALAAAELAGMGMTVYPTREERGKVLEQPTGEARKRAVAANLEAAKKLSALVTDRAEGVSEEDPMEFGRHTVLAAIKCYRDGGTMEVEDLALLSCCTYAIAVRDEAWSRMDMEFARQHLQLWLDTMQASMTALVPPIASLVAWTAWQCGDMALSQMAVEKALEVDADYNMANIIAGCLASGVPPTLAKPPMSPDEVARAYGREPIDD